MATLLEITLAKLTKSTLDSFFDTKKRQHVTGTVAISNIKYIPYRKSNGLNIEATVTSGSNKYDCSMSFQDVFYEDSDSNQVVTFTAVDNSEYHVHKIANDVNDVKVKCTCMDFYYRFAYANYQKDGLEGNPPPPYVKKTDRPPVNPTNAPGLCKHLIKLDDQLKTIGIIS
jgi:hypothetical protein